MNYVVLAGVLLALFVAPARAEIYATVGDFKLDTEGKEPGASFLMRLRAEAQRDGLPTDDLTLRAIWLAEGFRVAMEQVIAPLIAPECKLPATEEELATFIVWWKEEVDARLPEGVEHQATSEGPQPSFRRDLVHVENNDAQSIARVQVERWKFLRCISGAYPGPLFREYTPAYFTKPGSRDISVVNRLPMPALIEIAPMSAYAQTFELALQNGVLKFANETYQSVFLTRYANPTLAYVEEQTAANYFAEPYWMQIPSPANDE